MKIVLLHPINHNKQEYSRGVHDLPEPLAEMFLAMKDASTQSSIARIPEKPPEPPAGTVEDIKTPPGRPKPKTP